MTNTITGKVARILNSRDLVINRGSNDGVEAGMRFAVLDSSADNITDPDSGEVLGFVQRTKVEVEAVQVENRLTVARTFRYRTVNIGGSGGTLGASGAVAQLFAPPKFVKKYQVIKHTGTDLEPLEDEDSNVVEIGDTVIQVKIDEDVPTESVIRSSASETPAE